MLKLNAYQFRQSLRSLVGTIPTCGWSYPDDMDADFHNLASDGMFTLPVDYTNISVIPERFALYTDVSRKGKSQLVQILQDRQDEAILTVDSYLAGKDAIHIAALIGSKLVLDSWLASMNEKRMNVTLRPIDDEQMILLSPLSSFVPSSTC